MNTRTLLTIPHTENEFVCIRSGRLTLAATIISSNVINFNFKFIAKSENIFGKFFIQSHLLGLFYLFPRAIFLTFFTDFENACIDLVINLIRSKIKT